MTITLPRSWGLTVTLNLFAVTLWILFRYRIFNEVSLTHLRPPVIHDFIQATACVLVCGFGLYVCAQYQVAAMLSKWVLHDRSSSPFQAEYEEGEKERVKLKQYKHSTYNIKDLKLIAMAKVTHIYGNYARIIMAKCRRWSMEAGIW